MTAESRGGLPLIDLRQDARRGGGGSGSASVSSAAAWPILHRCSFAAAALLATVVLSSMTHNHCAVFSSSELVVAAGAATCAAASPAACVPSTGDRRRRPRVYMLANNPAANATWGRLQIGKQDLVVMFNLANPLAHFDHVPPQQMVIFLGQQLMLKGVINEEKLGELAQRFQRIVFVTCQLARRIGDGDALLLQQLLAVPHFESLDYKSDFIMWVWSDYKFSKIVKLPSTGYITYKYFQRYMPTHDIVLLGFSGEGDPVHNWQFEQVFADNCVRHM